MEIIFIIRVLLKLHFLWFHGNHKIQNCPWNQQQKKCNWNKMLASLYPQFSLPLWPRFVGCLGKEGTSWWGYMKGSRKDGHWTLVPPPTWRHSTNQCQGVEFHKGQLEVKMVASHPRHLCQSVSRGTAAQRAVRRQDSSHPLVPPLPRAFLPITIMGLGHQSTSLKCPQNLLFMLWATCKNW